MASASGARNAAVFGASTINNGLAAVLPGLAEAGARARGEIDRAEGMSIPALREAFGSARTSYGDARDRFQPFVDGGLKGWGGYLDASGVNGGEGHDRATAGFYASPDYQFRQRESAERASRQAAANGQLLSGNTLEALARRAGELASEEWGAHTSRLRDIGQTGYAATGAQAALDKGVGDLFADEGRAVGSVYDAGGARRAALTSGTANAMASAFMGGTNAIAGLGSDAFKASDKVKTDQENMWLNIAKLGATGLASAAGGGWFGGAR